MNKPSPGRKGPLIGLQIQVPKVSASSSAPQMTASCVYWKVDVKSSSVYDHGESVVHMQYVKTLVPTGVWTFCG